MTFELPQLTVSGSALDMGRQYGSHFRDMIHAFVADRQSAVSTYFEERGLGRLDALFDAGAACLEQVRSFDPAGYQEHAGIADGAQIDAVRLFTTANMTDVRDIIVLPDDPTLIEDEGCTAALIPPAMARDRRALQGQTWDLNGPDVDYVIALHRLPDEGPETWTVTCSGCQTLMGMNEHGITVGTTNLKTRGAKVGIPYLSLLHKALAQDTLAKASDLIGSTPVAGSHSYWVGDESEAIEWERTPQTAHSRSTKAGALARTNHCLESSNQALETDLSPSTHERHARIESLMAASDVHTLEGMKTMFANREDGPQSINRFAEDNSGATTNAVIACDPGAREFWACRGNADKGEWVQLSFAD